MSHIPVLLKETIEGLDIKSGDIYVDGTCGGGGHAVEIAKLGAQVICFDLDKKALERVKDTFVREGIPNIPRVIQANFKDIKIELARLNINSIDKILFDLGLSSFEIDESGRGFTFMKDEPLIMTFDDNPKEDDVTALKVVNEWGEENLADIIYGFGQEQFSRRIAKAICTERKIHPIKTTFELREIISKAVPNFYRFRKIHPATKTFQAIRMAVNSEILNLEEGLKGAWDVLNPNGRIAVITFHSLEDRIVKNFFKSKNESKEGILYSKKVIKPSREEILENPRSRSSKLRILIKK